MLGNGVGCRSRLWVSLEDAADCSNGYWREVDERMNGISQAY